MMLKTVASMLLSAIAVQATAQAITWDARFYDPAGGTDLVLPMPCGGAMAFQKVLTPVSPEDPLDDRRLRLGTGDPETGYVDFLRQAFLRGAFTEASTGETWFWMARYELTASQARALRGDCAPADARGSVPATGLSWFDALDLTRRYSEWLRKEAAGALPAEEGAPGFVRLPTEVEWEYAARGGARVSPTEFQGRLPPMTGALKDHAWHQGAESARGQFRPVGRLQPNPLGLYDMFGNAEEMMLEPFRLNNLGRPGGQVGGVVSRGGSIFSDPGAIYSAQRQEWSPFDAQTGAAQAQPSFGARFVVATHVTVTLERINAIRAQWLARSTASPEAVADPIGQLAAIIEEETQPERRAALEAVRAEFLTAERLRNEARLDALKSTFFAGAAQTRLLQEFENRIAAAERLKADYTAAERDQRAAGNIEDADFYASEIPTIEEALGRHRASYALSRQAFERLLSAAAAEDYTASMRRQARDVLDLELLGAGLAEMRPAVQRFARATDQFATAPSTPLETIIESVMVR